MAQELPLWGVMYNDGSVASRWNGATQRQRAEEEIAAYVERWGTKDHVTLAHRPSSDAPWERFEEPDVGKVPG